MVKVRRLSGEAGLTDKILISSKNINYVYLMVLSLSNHRPSNNNISFKDGYAKTTITKKRTDITPLSIGMFSRPVGPESI